MGITDVAAALLSALLHAGWNAAVKANRNPAQAMTAQMLLGAVLVVPALLWSGLPDPAAWIWILASTLMNVLTISALLRAYELGGFGLVYPVMRAVAVLLVVPMAAVLTGEKFGPAALAGIIVIALSLAVLSLDAARNQAVTLKALGWTLAAGVGTAAYIMCDAQGVRASGNPWAYGFVVSITNAAAMCWRQRRQGPPWRQLNGQWFATLPIAMASMASYLLILWVWSHAPIAPAAALRDTSSIFAILIAVVWLKEPFTRTRIVAVLMAAVAIPLLRLG
ncbi:EamA family transporter [Hyphomonas sp.]|uniref:EamA family transporter n=1 Tax=Hyphomonas sp. TaxID=87 RepID=UPI0025B974C2|nr:EamA family transporter [Hyphomonas sp.]